MTPQDLFGVAIRTSGLWLVLWGTYTLSYAVLYYCWPHQTAAAKDSEASPPVNVGIYLYAGVIEVLMGLAVISLADDIARRSY